MKKKLLSLALTLALVLGLAAPVLAANGYGPYVITGTARGGSAYTVSFEAAKVEKKSVKIRDKMVYAFGAPEETGPYRNENIVLVTLKPGSNVSLSCDDIWDSFSIREIALDGNDQYTIVEREFILRETLEETLKEDLETGASMLEAIGGVNYIVVYEDMYNGTVQPAFTDVKAGAYYEDAVAWAVKENITSGTSATTFSPDQTCTVAQILTFLWRANGSPEPTGRNPFSNISATDYFYKPANWAYEKGLIPDTGYFNENAPCTRHMVAYFLWKLAGTPTSVSAGKYTTQNITVVDEGQYYLKFTAAVVEETTIMKHVPIYADDGDYVASWRDTPAKVTLVTMYPGSTVTVSNTLSTSNVIFGNAYTIGADGKYYDLAWQFPIEMYTGAVENAFQYSTGVMFVAFELPTVMELNSYDESRHIYQTHMLQMAPVSTGFSDVSANAVYAQAVAWAVEKGITAGTSATTFSPNAVCTRGQIVTFLHRAMG